MKSVEHINREKMARKPAKKRLIELLHKYHGNLSEIAKALKIKRMELEKMVFDDD